MVIAAVALHMFILLLASLWLWAVINTNHHHKEKTSPCLLGPF